MSDEDEQKPAPETPIAVGDVVQLKSGGPRMTVSAVDGEKVVCVWFVRENSDAVSSPFALATVKRVD